MRKTIAAAAALAAGVLLAGCEVRGLTGPLHRAGPLHRERVTYQVAERVARLDVESGAGDIVIDETGRADVRVTETLTWRTVRPRSTHEVGGDTLTLRYSCPDSVGGCGVDYRVEVPKGLLLRAGAGAGDVTLRAVSGDAEVISGAGDIEAAGLLAGKVEARTDAGDVRLSFQNAPDRVRTASGAGDVTLYLPKSAYDVSADTGAGSREVAVAVDPSSPRKVTLSTGAGNARVLERE